MTHAQDKKDALEQARDYGRRAGWDAATINADHIDMKKARGRSFEEYLTEEAYEGESNSRQFAGHYIYDVSGIAADLAGDDEDENEWLEEELMDAFDAGVNAGVAKGVKAVMAARKKSARTGAKRPPRSQRAKPRRGGKAPKARRRSSAR